MPDEEFPSKIPEDAVCDVCKRFIDMASGVAVQQMDDDGDTKVGPIIWFHKGCLNLTGAH